MKIKVEEKSTKEVEIHLPYYSTDELHYYKVFGENENENVCVTNPPDDSSIGFAIQIHNSNCHAFASGCNPCTKEDFEKAYNNALKNLNNNLNK